VSQTSPSNVANSQALRITTTAADFSNPATPLCGSWKGWGVLHLGEGGAITSFFYRQKATKTDKKRQNQGFTAKPPKSGERTRLSRCNEMKADPRAAVDALVNCAQARPRASSGIRLAKHVFGPNHAVGRESPRIFLFAPIVSFFCVRLLGIIGNNWEFQALTTKSRQLGHGHAAKNGARVVPTRSVPPATRAWEVRSSVQCRHAF
jgi:hypothetical protein